VRAEEVIGAHSQFVAVSGLASYCHGGEWRNRD
jgi:hypothetical protein